MDIFANELSIHNQFHDLSSFHNALRNLMALRSSAQRFRRDVYCGRSFLNVNPVSGMPIQQALNKLSNNESRAMMHWLTRGGPFWDDLRRHDADDYLECRGDVVTNFAVGEAAYRKLFNVDCGLISVKSSDWDHSPIEVSWRREAEGLEDQNTNLENWRDVESLESSLHDAAPPIQSWYDLQNTSSNQLTELTFSDDCFAPLDGVPFTKSSADRIFVLLSILEKSARAFDATGMRTLEGHQYDRDYFQGEHALFSDSSDTEKQKFRKKLTFPHPDKPGESLFCTWHGKERHNTLRVHFSWPFQFGKPVYVVYVGRKRTML